MSGSHVPKTCENGPLMITDVNIMDCHGDHSYANILCIVFYVWEILYIYISHLSIHHQDVP